jgi:tellurite resistance protein
MALGLAEQWTLVACAVLAHADGVMDGEECDRLMTLIEDAVDGEEYSQWLATISDPKGLEELMSTLEPPDPAKNREILEQAWSLAIVDGERSSSELAALVRIAHRLGVEPVQLDFWREAWTSSQEEFAESIARTLAVVLGGGAPVYPDDRKVIGELVWRLPTSNEHREQLNAVAIGPQSHDDLESKLNALPRAKRSWLMRLIAPTLRAASRPDEARDRFIDFAGAVGFDEERARSMLDE